TGSRCARSSASATARRCGSCGASRRDDGGVLNQPKQMKRAVEAFVETVAPSLRDVVQRLPDLQATALDRDVATEAFNLTTALIDVDRSHTDDELWGLIFAFGRWLPDQLARAKPDDLRRSDLLAGRASWL